MKIILQITKGLIRDQSMRRMAMFVILLLALVMLFIGSIFLNASWSGRPLLLLSYWAVCAWLTFCAVLLAVYDVIVLRLAARRERRRLKEEIFGGDGNKHD